MGAMASLFRNILNGCLLVLGMEFYFSAPAQEVAGNPDAPFLMRFWQNEQGLPNNTVNAVTQTRDGYLWLGTDEGLARFDGVHCRVFGLADGLKNLQISALLEDRSGVLWIGTAGGGVGRLVQDEIKTYTVADGLVGDSISSFVEAANGDVWVGTHTGLSRWHNGRFEPVAKELGPMLVFGLAKNRAGDIWAATLHNGLLCFTNGEYSYAEWQAATKSDNPRCVFVDSHDRVWAGLREKAILCRENGVWTRYGTNEGFPEVVTYCLAETSDGNIWAGSWNEGLYCFQNETGRFSALQKKDGLSDDAILSLFAGREQFLWAGTQSGGLNRIGPKKLSVHHVMEGASEGQLRSLAQTTNGEFWVGTYGQGVYQWLGGQFTPFQETRLRAHLLVEAMLSARDGSLWWGAGPSLYQRKDGQLISYFGDPPWLIGDRVWSLCEDRVAGIWVGTYNGKLGLLKQRKFTAVKNLSGKPVTALAQEADGTLWIGSLGGGLARLQNEKLTVFTTKDGLQSDLVRTLLLDADGTLWIGTDGGGLNRWSHGHMVGFTTRQGLLDDIIQQILEDDAGCLWLGGNRGICRVSKRVLNDVAEGKNNFVHPLNFGISEGMASEECVGNFGAALKTQSGRLCFATAKGIVVIDPRQQTHAALLPDVLLEEVLVDKQILKRTAWQGAANFDHAGSNSPNSVVTIPAGRHSFDFHFTGIGFDAPERIQFRYWLEGLDSWSEWGTIREAHYSYLPPGTYRFHVQASNLNGQWNEPGAGMSFVVLPFFWQRLWFELLSACVLIGLIAAGIRLIERRRYRARLKRMEQERAMQNERVRIARDLHDELGSSLTYISMSITDIGQSPENSATQLKAKVEKISSFAVRTARALDEIVWAVNPRNDSLRSLVEYLTQLARELFENTEVHCRFQIPDNLPEVPLPPDMRHNIFLVVKETLNNALKHSRATEISLGAKTDGRQIEISLQDNGTGFNLAAVPAQGERNGLENMRQRIAALGGRLVIETKPGQGTTIRLTIDSPSGPAPGGKPSV
jgi:signal transduction histidine kinase/ligand-binding sensor domain-containing protein